MFSYFNSELDLFQTRAGRCSSRPPGGSSDRFSCRTQVNCTQPAPAVCSSVSYKNRLTTWNVSTRTCRSRGSCTQMTCREEVLHHRMHDGEEELQYYRRRMQKPKCTRRRHQRCARVFVRAHTQYPF